MNKTALADMADVRRLEALRDAVRIAPHGGKTWARRRLQAAMRRQLERELKPGRRKRGIDIAG